MRSYCAYLERNAVDDYIYCIQMIRATLSTANPFKRKNGKTLGVC